MMLTILDRGRHIPTARLLYTKSFQKHQKKKGHWKWSSAEWNAVLKQAEKELS